MDFTYGKQPCALCKDMCKRTFEIALCSLKCRLKYYVSLQGECWIWKGKKGQDGYGLISVAGKRKRAHRVSYETFIGPISYPNLILHSCHNSLCICPDHLREGTVKDNSQDMIEAVRNKRGQDKPSSKLRNGDIMEIRTLSAQGWSQTKIAAKFGVSQVLIGLILRRKVWSHI